MQGVQGEQRPVDANGPHDFHGERQRPIFRRLLLTGLSAVALAACDAEPRQGLDDDTPTASTVYDTERVPDDLAANENDPVIEPLYKQAEKLYSREELLDFARETDWFMPEPVAWQLDDLRRQGVIVPDPETAAADDEPGDRARVNSVFRILLGDAGVPVTFNYDPSRAERLPNSDEDLDAQTLSRHLYGLATGMSLYPAAFFGNLEHVYIGEDRGIVTSENGYQKASSDYLYVIIGGEEEGAMFANVRGLWPYVAPFDMAHEGAHVVQISNGVGDLFEQHKKSQPPLGDLLEWFNETGRNLDQAHIIEELLQNTGHDDPLEDQAGVFTTSVRSGLLRIPENTDETSEEYIRYLQGKQAITLNWFSDQTGIDMFAFVAFIQEFESNHPAEVLRAADNGSLPELLGEVPASQPETSVTESVDLEEEIEESEAEREARFTETYNFLLGMFNSLEERRASSELPDTISVTRDAKGVHKVTLIDNPLEGETISMLFGVDNNSNYFIQASISQESNKDTFVRVRDENAVFFIYKEDVPILETDSFVIEFDTRWDKHGGVSREVFVARDQYGRNVATVNDFSGRLQLGEVLPGFGESQNLEGMEESLKLFVERMQIELVSQ